MFFYARGYNLALYDNGYYSDYHDMREKVRSIFQEKTYWNNVADERLKDIQRWYDISYERYKTITELQAEVNRLLPEASFKYQVKKRIKRLIPKFILRLF
jgi:uncharacterized protein (DUF3084 family)